MREDDILAVTTERAAAPFNPTTRPEISSSDRNPERE